jgi:hypothetical protein
VGRDEAILVAEAMLPVYKQALTGLLAHWHDPPKPDAPTDGRRSSVVDTTRRASVQAEGSRRASTMTEPRRASAMGEPRRASTMTEPRRASTMTEPRRASTMDAPAPAPVSLPPGVELTVSDLQDDEPIRLHEAAFDKYAPTPVLHTSPPHLTVTPNIHTAPSTKVQVYAPTANMACTLLTDESCTLCALQVRDRL